MGKPRARKGGGVEPLVPAGAGAGACPYYGALEWLPSDPRPDYL